MTYYLVTAQIQKTPYMGDTETFSDQRLVKADDAVYIRLKRNRK